MQPLSDSFPTADTVLYLWKKKWLLGIAFLVAGIGAYVYARTLPEYFKASVNCVPPKTDQSSLGGLMGGMSSTLRDFGLTKFSGGKGETYDFIVILFSRSLRDSMARRFDLEHEYDLVGKGAAAVRDEFENNVEINFHPEGNYEITVWSRDPHKAADMCAAFIEYANQLANRVARDEASRATSYLERRILSMDSSMTDISARLGLFSKKYHLFSPLDQAKASASALSELKGNALKQETILGLLEQTYGKEDPQSKTQRFLVNELQAQLHNAENKPGFAGNFPITDAAGVGADYMRLYSEMEANLKVKAFLLPTLEQTRLDMQKNTPSLLVIDTPIAAEKKDRPKRGLIALGAAFGTDVLLILILLAFRGWKSLTAPVVTK